MMLYAFDISSMFHLSSFLGRNASNEAQKVMSRYGFLEIQRLLSLTLSYIKGKTGKEDERPWMTLQKFQHLLHIQLILEKGLVCVQ